jgi:GNAT superfamily N-acetyltransferase
VQDIKLDNYVPGAIGRIAEMHAAYYHKNWGFGVFFEIKVATELAAFLNRFDRNQDMFRTVCRRNRVEGAITIDGVKAKTDGAHLRWFITSSEIRGHGCGSRLMQEAVNFCQTQKYPQIYLWTFKGLHAARHLYEKFGFKLADQNEGAQWGSTVIEQKFILRF